MALLTDDQIASMADALASTLLFDHCTNSRTALTLPCHLVPDGTIDLGGDGRIAPLTRFHLTLPADTDLQPADTLYVDGQGPYFVTATDTPLTYGVCVMAYAIQLYEPATPSPGLTTNLVDVYRAGSLAFSEILVHIEPTDPKPFELVQAPDRSQGETIFDHFLLITLMSALPDILARDEIRDPSAALDPFTGQAPVYYVRRVKRWEGSHLEIECDRIASAPTT